MSTAQQAAHHDLGMTPNVSVSPRISYGRHPEHHYKIECRDAQGNLAWVEEFHNRVVVAGHNKYLDATLKTGLTTPAWYVGLIGALVTDGAITSGAAVLTSASNPFTSAMVGGTVIVKGAGAAGADLVTTITTYTNAGSVTLTANAGTTVTGAKVAVEPVPASVMSSHADWVEDTSYSNTNRPTWTPGSISAGSVDNSGSVAVFTINATADIFGAFLADNNTKGGTTGTLLGGGLFSSGTKPVASGYTFNMTVTATSA